MGSFVLRGMMADEPVSPTSRSPSSKTATPRKSKSAGKSPTPTSKDKTIETPTSSSATGTTPAGKTPPSSSGERPAPVPASSPGERPAPVPARPTPAPLSPSPWTPPRSKPTSKSPTAKIKPSKSPKSKDRASSGASPSDNGGSMWFKVASVAAVLSFGIVVFFVVIILVDARARLPSIALQRAEIYALEPVGPEHLYVNMVFLLNASSHYSVNFKFSAGTLFLAYKINSTVAYNIGQGPTERFNVGGGHKFERLQIPCNNTLEVPGTLVKDFENESASPITKRLYIHGVFRARYQASTLLPSFRRRVNFCRNLTIDFNKVTPSLIHDEECHN